MVGKMLASRIAMKDHKTTLADLKRLVAGFIAEREWEKYHLPKNLAASILIEAAELMEHFQWTDHAESARLVASRETRGEIADEMADVLAFLLSLSNVTGIDLAAALESKMKRNRRKYPAEQVRGRYERPRGRKRNRGK